MPRSGCRLFLFAGHPRVSALRSSICSILYAENCEQDGGFHSPFPCLLNALSQLEISFATSSGMAASDPVAILRSRRSINTGKLFTNHAFASLQRSFRVAGFPVFAAREANAFPSLY